MNKQLYFLSGLPRSGSTVLAAIMNQNPMTHVSATSGLTEALGGLARTWQSVGILHGNDPEQKLLAQTMLGVIDAFYAKISQPVAVDKSRAWPAPAVMNAMSHVLGRKPKIVATVRSIPDCMASFVRVAKPVSLDEFMATSQLVDHLKSSYIQLLKGYQYDKTSFVFVEYDDLLADPQAQLDRIHNFLELPFYAYNFNDIDGSNVMEDDEHLHGYAGLHDIKSKLEKQHNEDSKDVLQHHYGEFCQPEFWRAATPVHRMFDLDLQLEASISGDFTEGWRLAQKIETEEPKNNRAAFNRGWYALRQGHIQTGYKLLDRGRIAGVFGDKKPSVSTEAWCGQHNSTVLLYLEGGFGDQLHQARYAKDIAAHGNRVVVSCAGPLVSLMSEIEGVSAVMQRGVEYGVYHDFFVQGMSAIVPLGLELTDISGKPYINKDTVVKGQKRRIGLRWRGDQAFEVEHRKRFPAEPFFACLEGVDAEFISLQRDGGTELCPSWVKTVPLDSWHATKSAISSCDLVISSCTSVSHLASAMGVNTWVIVPIMPYFLYALDGDKTPYYDSMTLIRQQVYNDWQNCFDQIRNKLAEKEF